jgi:hypothetical protein
MPRQDYPDPTADAEDSPVTQPRQASLSRRSVLRRGAAAGAVGLAVAAGGGGAVAAVMSSPPKGEPGQQPAPETASAGPIVIYMADPRSGEMEIFAGTSRTRHKNQAMASMVASMAPR